MKTASLALGITSITISVLFWALIIYGALTQVGDDLTALGLGVAWFFFGVPAIGGLSIASVMTAFRSEKPSGGATTVQRTRTAKIVSLISLALLIAPFLWFVFIGPMIH